MEFTLETKKEVKRHPKIIGNLSGLLKQNLGNTPSESSGEIPVNTGILLLALGHPFYGEMAANLAMSLKCNGSPKIHLVHHGSALKHLSEKKRELFDSMTLCPDDAILKNDKIAYFKAKTWMYDLSPFDNTLFLDVDMVFFRSVIPLFDSLKDVEFTIQNREYYDLSEPDAEKKKWMWAKVTDLKKHFTEGKLYSLHSELVWFKKSAKNKEYFDWVKEFYDKPLIPPTEFAGDIADELAFALACLTTNTHPHKTPFLPVYWYKLDSKEGTEITRLKEKFFAYSAGGNNLSQLEQKKYNLLARGYAYRMGVQNPFRIKPKRQFLPERQLL